MREAACQGPGACDGNQGTVAEGRCVSPYASVANEASVGESACREEAACAFAKGSIGKDNHLQGGNGARGGAFRREDSLKEWPAVGSAEQADPEPGRPGLEHPELLGGSRPSRDLGNRRLVEVMPEGKREVAKLPTEVGIDKIRMYEFVNDQLKLSLRDAAGKVTATATWRRAP